MLHVQVHVVVLITCTVIINLTLVLIICNITWTHFRIFIFNLLCALIPLQFGIKSIYPSFRLPKCPIQSVDQMNTQISEVLCCFISSQDANRVWLFLVFLKSKIVLLNSKIYNCFSCLDLIVSKSSPLLVLL